LIITEELEDKVIAMYAMEISATEISHITDKPGRRAIIPLMNEWRNRPLEAIYPFVFMDCIPL